ncbi:MAG: hypothetical protein ACLU9S_24105 [Oscillospiraceae bacterium]
MSEDIREGPEEQADLSDFNFRDITFTYCTEFFIQETSGQDPEELLGLPPRAGRQLVLVDDDEIIKVIHTNNALLACRA